MTRIARKTLVSTLALSIGLAGAPVFAAPPKPPAKGAKEEAKKPKTVGERLPPDAKKHWDSALLLYEDSNWEGALTEFKTAYDMSKEPRVLRNVAVCEKNLKRYSDAIATLQKAVVEGTDFEPELSTQIKDEIDILMPLTSMITVEVSEPGAEVSVDGRVIGTSPLSGTFRVNVGERSFTAKKAGFLDITVKQNVAGSTGATVKLVLEPVVKMGMASVAVNGLPGTVKAKITIDGVEVGEAPYKASLTAGKHTFEISAPGYVTKKVTKDVEYKQTTAIEVGLDKEKHEGTVAIDTGVPDAQIKLDDKVVATGSFKGVIPSGGHRVSVSADGYKPYDTDVTVLDNQTRSVSIQLEKNSKTWLWLTGGAVILAGAGVGAYFLFKPKDEQPIPGTISPGVVNVPLFRGK
ncbi:MAG: PEGA domain-containing protein [Polyangiales bacterium]